LSVGGWSGVGNGRSGMATMHSMKNNFYYDFNKMMLGRVMVEFFKTVSLMNDSDIINRKISLFD
jgi:hypothetical protein